jgi:cholesterol oxidase
MKTNLSRRKFIGLSAVASAATLSGGSMGLSSCTPEHTTVSPADGSDFPAIVIGSGFGGSVAALRLTGAGVNTLMLEMGKQYEVQPDEDVFCKMFSPDGRSFWMRTRTAAPVTTIQFNISKYAGVLDKVEFPGSYMSIYRGTCLGGGSVVYGAMLPFARPEMWNEFFPYIPYSDMLDKWYPKVKNVLHFGVIPDDILNSEVYRFARVGLKHCERAGFEKVMLNAGVDFDIIRGELNGTVKKSATGQELLYGVNNGFKNSLDRNYIPAALASGKLTISTLHQVDHVRQLPNGKYEVHVIRIDEFGNPIQTKIYTCKHLFINAGVVGSMQILLKSKHLGGLPALNDEVGKHWGNNGNVMAMRTLLFDKTGTEQSTVPVTAYANLDNPYTPLLAEQAPFPVGIELNQLLMLAITKNPNRGSFTYNPATDKAELQFDRAQMELSRKAMGHFVEKLNQVNGGALEREFYFNGTGFGDDFTYHPLGGAVLGLASDHYGRLKGYTNLYCMDGSMIPGFTCCANPALTIAAIAERNMETVLSEDF